MTRADVKIFGERNTSTNALKLIVETNSDSRCIGSKKSEIDGDFGRTLYAYQKLRRIKPFRRAMDQKIQDRIDGMFAANSVMFSWKHCATYFDSVDEFSELLILFTVRHPASWLVSMFRKPHAIIGRRPGSMSEFIDYNWKTVDRERLGKKSFRPLDLLQEKIRSYRAFQDRLDANNIPYAVLKFEDIVIRQSEAFSSIAGQLVNPRDNFQPLVRSTKDAGKSLEDYIADYRNEKWRQDIAGLEGRINDGIDWDLFEPFGYTEV